jgi:hypothetical protein
VAKVDCVTVYYDENRLDVITRTKGRATNVVLRVAVDHDNVRTQFIHFERRGYLQGEDDDIANRSSDTAGHKGELMKER